MASPMPSSVAIDRRQSTVTYDAGSPPIIRRESAGAPEVGSPPIIVTDAPLTPVSEPSSVQTEQVVIDYAIERQATLVRTSRLISFSFGVIVTLIAIRVLLKLIAANAASPFAQFIYSVAGVFVAPFVGLTATPAVDGAVLDLSSLIAAVIYALVGWALIKLFWVLFDRPATRRVNIQTYHSS